MIRGLKGWWNPYEKAQENKKESQRSSALYSFAHILFMGKGMAEEVVYKF